MFKIPIEKLDIFVKCFFVSFCFERIGQALQVFRLQSILFSRAIITHVHLLTFSALKNYYSGLPPLEKEICTLET